MYKLTSGYCFILLYTLTFFSVCQVKADPRQKIYVVKSAGIELGINGDGQIISIRNGNKKSSVLGQTIIQGYKLKEVVGTEPLTNGGISIKKYLVNDSTKQSCSVVETFVPVNNAIRWNVSITGGHKETGIVVRSVIKYVLNKSSLFWAPWGGPRYDSSNRQLTDLIKATESKDIKRTLKQWHDPLLPVPLSNQLMYYGAPYLRYEEPMIHCNPYREDVICIPMYTILDADKKRRGLLVYASPEDSIVDLTLTTTAEGEVSFSRLHSRLPAGKPVNYSIELASIENDWRSAMGRVTERYPDYFNPPLKHAFDLNGTAAYANPFDTADYEKMKRMAFATNWQASYDFPYMGMFLPPVSPTEEWQRVGGKKMSIAKMNDYALSMKQKGLHVLNYFNVTEFGLNIVAKDTLHKVQRPERLWENASWFLYESFPEAILKVPEKMNTTGWPRTKPGSMHYSWKNSVAMDCGDSTYRHFLLQQARRHINEIPASSGIAIDRMDWLRMFNEKNDDGISWFDGKPARSLIMSWRSLMEPLTQLMHESGKAVFLNNHTKRIDIVKNTDGFFDEFTYAGAALNLTALMSVNKPALGWIDSASTIKNAGGDAFIQKFLYMGVFPMCPFPGNSHSSILKPDPYVDSLYIDYGPLMEIIKERRWVLRPNAVQVYNNAARANIFSVPGGYAIPVVYAQEGVKDVTVECILPANETPVTGSVYHPGKDKPVTVNIKRKGKSLLVQVPVQRKCAMIIIKTK